MGSFRQMTLQRYRMHKQVRDIKLFAHWAGLSFDAAVTRWCENDEEGCAGFWNKVN